MVADAGRRLGVLGFVADRRRPHRLHTGSVTDRAAPDPPGPNVLGRAAMCVMLPRASQAFQVGTLHTGKLRIRYAVPFLHQGPDSCSNRADFGLMSQLEHPYQHPYAVAPAAAMVDDCHKMWRRTSRRHQMS